MQITNSCRCCLLRPPNKSLKMPYTRFGKTEIYANMLKECFEIHLSLLPTDCEYGICEMCVGRLQDANDFKLQVQRSQVELLAWMPEDLEVKEEDSVKSEKSDDDVDQEELIVSDFSIKIKPEISVDPLPIVAGEEYKEFLLGLENQETNMCKQGQQFDESIKADSTFTKSEIEIINDKFESDIKCKKERSDVGVRTKNDSSRDTCGTPFAQKTELREYKRIRETKYMCETCNKQFRCNALLIAHKLIHTGEKLHTCEICKRRFSDKSGLRKHTRVHIAEKSFTCDICNEQFKYKHSLFLHMGKHTEQKHSHCKNCSRRFSDRNRLEQHIKKCHDRVYYICDECKKVFRYRRPLIEHLNVHTKWIVYPCDVCDVKLSSKSSLKRHKLIHTNEKPYPCELCNKRFRYKHGLNAHILLHTGEKPYCCEICGKQFAQTNNLKKHLQIHIEGMTYACELCSKSYSTSEGLRQHRRTHTKNKAKTKSVKGR